MAPYEGSFDLKRPYAAPDSAARIRATAERFLHSLDGRQQETVLFDFEDQERFFWHYTPVDRRGLPLRDMDENQLQCAYVLMASGLAPRGFAQAKAIIDHELILGALERESGTVRFDRDPGLYFFSLFGDPSQEESWGFRIDGHHLSLHFTIVDGSMLAVTPSFFGANPARVPRGPRKGLRVLSAAEDLGRELVMSLDPPQRSRTMISDIAPRDIVTTNSRQAALDKLEGMPAGDMSGSQRKLLMRLLNEFIERKAPEVARRESRKLEGRAFDGAHFAWAGSLEPEQPHYYRIHSGDFLVEYDNVQDGANHIHSVWRDLHNDFGVDLLRQHYQGHHPV